MNRHRTQTSRGIVALLGVLGVAIIGIYPTIASAAVKYHLQFDTQPTDSVAGSTIAAVDFTGGQQGFTPVQVSVRDESGALVTNSPATVTFTLAAGPGLASGHLSVTPQDTVDGVATFGEGTLSIADANEAQLTDYKLVPKSTKGPSITGAASDGFDIWQTACSGSSCPVTLRNGNEAYTNGATGNLSASEVAALPGLSCPGQTVIFSGEVFEHKNTDPAAGPVFLRSHVTRTDMKKASNNGQAHVIWCIGLLAPVANGGTYVQEDTDADGVLDLYVGAAPACPNMNPSASAPCITRQYGDGNGGSFTEGWLPPDPPRRT